jgi:hypothetical protein
MSPVKFTEPGKWRLSITILRNGEPAEAAGTIDVAQVSGMAAANWSFLAIPPLMIVLFVIRERLILRKR